MRILITGGAGFIGSHLAEKLVSLKHNVAVLDDLSVGKKSYLDAVINAPTFNFALGSVLDQAILIKLIENQDVVFHLAASLGVQQILDRPLFSITTNLDGTKNVLEAATQTGTRVFIASTSEVYGKNTKVPFSENDDRTVGPTNVRRWSYSASKAMDEFLAFAYMYERKLPVVITRLFNIVGPRQSTVWGFVLARFVERARKNEPLIIFGDGMQRRCFGYVTDIVDAYIRLLDCAEANGQVINLGSDEEVSINDLAKLVIEVTGSKSKIEYQSYEKAYGNGFEDMMRRVPDLTKINKLTGWKPTTTLKSAIIRIMNNE